MRQTTRSFRSAFRRWPEIRPRYKVDSKALYALDTAN